MKIFKMLFSRVALIAVFAVIEIAILVMINKWFLSLATWIEGAIRLLSIVIVFYIIRHSKHLSSDLMWIMIIVMFPIPGTIAYLFLGANLFTSGTFFRLTKETKTAKKYYIQDEKVMKELIASDREMKGQFRYISETEGFPFYRNTGFEYYPLGDEGYPVMLEELRKAEKFIFLEYFIIEPGVMWDGILRILAEKAKQGVEVRVMYDDMGSINTLPSGFVKQMEEKGIECVSFNRMHPLVKIVMNHRDHRKIMVIDGKTAFSGGINLADEYINKKLVHGHWKDNVIRIKGEAVWSYTVMFLTNWNAVHPEDTDYTVFKAEQPETDVHDGYIAAYGETPLDDSLTAQNIYLNILNQANEYCYIMTPYLMIDTEMMNALTLAAGRGVDVRLITPGVPDKDIIWKISRTYYQTLLDGGVRIFEYTPGFVHAKVFVSDDKVMTVGTVNLDYRSLYLHYENGTYVYRSSKISDVRQDCLNTLEQCREMHKGDVRQPAVMEMLLSFLRLFTPLM